MPNLKSFDLDFDDQIEPVIGSSSDNNPTPTAPPPPPLNCTNTSSSISNTCVITFEENLEEADSSAFCNSQSVSNSSCCSYCSAIQRLSPRSIRVASSTTSPSDRVAAQDQSSPSLAKYRWLSLRNVISFSNVLINFFAILAISVVSYLASFQSTQSAIQAMSHLTLSDIKLRLDNSLQSAQLGNVHTESAFRFGGIQLNNTGDATKLLIFTYNAGRQLGSIQYGQVDQIYIVSDKQIFNGVGLYRPPGINSVNLNSNDQDAETVIKFMNEKTQPSRLTLLILDDNCTSPDMEYYCTESSKFSLISNASYIVSSRPFYQQAVSQMRPGWSDIYSFASEGVLGLTATRPIMNMDANNTKTITAVAAVDITLQSLGIFLASLAQTITSNNNANSQNDLASLVIWIVESKNGLLVATSQPFTTKTYVTNATDKSVTRIKACDSENDVIKSSTNFLQQVYFNKDNTNADDGSDEQILDFGSNVLLVSRYNSQEDLDWTIVMHIPSAIFLGQLSQVYLINIPLVTGIVLIFSVLVSIAVTRCIGRPLKNISEKMLRVANLNFDEDDEVISRNQAKKRSLLSRIFRLSEANEKELQLKEIKYLQSAMRTMTSGLKSFSKYVPLDVVKLLLLLKKEAVLGVEECNITIFFSDIEGFTGITEAIDSQSLVLLMSEYLNEVSRIIIESNGLVDKYIGDAVMAFWNAPVQLNNHAEVACTAALKCQERLQRLQTEWLRKGFPKVHTRIGINTGPALVGNFGSPTRLNYTALGDSVNIASRLEALNKRFGTSIIISQSTFISVQHKFQCKSLGTVLLRGKQLETTPVYELIGFK